jgi:hypothetical protein
VPRGQRDESLQPYSRFSRPDQLRLNCLNKCVAVVAQIVSENVMNLEVLKNYLFF